jgi:hypothetical protein
VVVITHPLALVERAAAVMAVETTIAMLHRQELQTEAVVAAVAVTVLTTPPVVQAAPALSSSSTPSHHRLYSLSSHRLAGLAQQV